MGHTASLRLASGLLQSGQSEPGISTTLQQKEHSVAITVTDRILEVLECLRIDRAHFAASMLADVADFAQGPRTYCIAHACLSTASR